MTKINFIHIPKNAGMTIRRAPELSRLISISGPGNHISPEYSKNVLETMNKYNQHHGYEHARWRDLKDSLRKNKSFAIVRNPWSKVVSRYTFGKKLHGKYTFEEFLEQRHLYGKVPYFWHRPIKGWYLQKDHVTDEEGQLQCDILRIEHFDEDIKKYFNLTKSLHIRNVSNGKKLNNKTIVENKKDYRDYYTSKTKKIIADWYAEDIEFFGFTFDSPATKNIWNTE